MLYNEILAASGAATGDAVTAVDAVESLPFAAGGGGAGSTFKMSSNGAVDDRGVCGSSLIASVFESFESFSLPRELVMVCNWGLRAALADFEVGSPAFSW